MLYNDMFKGWRLWCVTWSLVSSS